MKQGAGLRFLAAWMIVMVASAVVPTFSWQWIGIVAVLAVALHLSKVSGVMEEMERQSK